MAVAVTIRGVDYPSLRAAARAIGVSSSAVGRALRAGVLDDCGFAPRGPKPMPVRVNDVVYGSAAIAAERLGCSPQVIYYAIARGYENDVCKPESKLRNGRAKPFALAGVTFLSQAAASRAFGFGPNYVCRAFSRNCKRAQGRVMAAAAVYAAQQSVGVRAHG